MACNLEGVLILSDPNPRIVERRVKRVVDYAGDRDLVFLACGGKTPYLFHQHRDECEISIGELLARGVNSANIATEHNSQDTVGNILFSLGRFWGDKITVVSNPEQNARAREIIEAGKAQGVIRRDLQVSYVDVPSTPGEKLYEFLISKVTKKQIVSGLKPVESYSLLPAIAKTVLMKIRDAINWVYFGFDWK